MHAGRVWLGYGRNSGFGLLGVSHGNVADSFVVARETEAPAGPIATHISHIGYLIVFVVLVEVR
jgi:hypothetical protein